MTLEDEETDVYGMGFNQRREFITEPHSSLHMREAKNIAEGQRANDGGIF